MTDKKVISIRHDGMINIATGKSRNSKSWKNKTITWSNLLGILSSTKYTYETADEYIAMSKEEQGNIKDVGGFVGAELKEDGSRSKSNIKSRALITLDIDYGKPETWDCIEMLFDFACCIYSTHSHRQDNPRYRLIIPLSKAITPEEYEAVSRMIGYQIDIEIFDDTTYEPNRLMYLPSTPKNGEYIFRFQDGPWLNPDEILKEYTFGWNDVGYWPKSSRVIKSVYKSIKNKQKDPLEKDGMIGAFCRTYSISESIETFLGDVYEPTAEEDRYTYIRGNSAMGLQTFEDKFAYSYQDSDPVSHMCCNSWDLVRIHKFGYLDKDTKAVETKDLSSFRKMMELARSDDKVNQIVLKEEFSKDGDTNEELEKKVDIAKKYIIKTQNGPKVNTGLLAEHIRENSKYLIVRKMGYDNDFLYWYEHGYYRRISSNELKGRIKSYIPESIRKPSQWEDTYKELITDTSSTNYEELDINENYINVKNGLYNIKTCELEEHSPDIKSTIQLNCYYKPDELKPKEWIKFIETLSNNDIEIISILQEWFGLVMSNIAAGTLKKCVALYGKIGDTGKTQYNNMLVYMLGKDNICSVPIQNLGKNFALGDLYGKRALIVDDQSSINMEDSSNFKALTGGGVVRCEIKGKQAFPYIYRGTITFGCNDLPYIKDDKGEHVFGRLIIIPCNNVIPYEKRDVNLLTKLIQEADGIFLWAMEGLKRLISNNYKFTHSKASDIALEDYRQLNDSLYRFIKEKYIITRDKKDKVKKTDFEYEYACWASQEEIHPVEKKNIKTRLEKHGIFATVKDGYPFYTGLTK